MIKRIVAWAIDRSAAMNTLMIAIILAGIFSFGVMRRESFPEFELEIILVTVPYPGAAPAVAARHAHELTRTGGAGTIATGLIPERSIIKGMQPGRVPGLCGRALTAIRAGGPLAPVLQGAVEAHTYLLHFTPG